MGNRSVVVIGLPESGKTTFLAALWHVVSSRELMTTALNFGSLRHGEVSHLNAIAARWRDAKVQDRTGVAGGRLVSMELTSSDGATIRVTFPDLPGEAYRRMWEERDCESEVAEVLEEGNVLLFIHSDAIVSPQWVVDEVALARKLGLAIGAEADVAWHPRLAPTQVQLVDLLQLLRVRPLDAGPRRLTIMLSAWDKVEAEGLAPREFLEAHLPLLAQYLLQGTDGWDWRVYGLSAQGGDYDPVEDGADKTQSAAELRKLDHPSTRIRLLIEGQAETHDLTEPLAWLMC